LNNDQQKIKEFQSLTSAYNKALITADDYVSVIWNSFGKNSEIVSKVTSGFADATENESGKKLLRAWEDRKAMV
jgi:hypothetical protein